MRPVLGLLVALGVLAAGCVGTEEAPALEAATDLVTGPSAEEIARTPGVLQGLVLTPSLAPIAGARVAFLRQGGAATTDASGFFRLEGATTGQHLLAVSADGYTNRTVLANARNGTIMEVNVTLVPAPSRDPYQETRELQGFLACGVLVPGHDGLDCASADPNHRDVFEFDVAPHGKQVVLELVWSVEDNPGARTLRLSAETVGYGAEDIDLGNATGEGHVRVAVAREVMEKFYPEGGLLRARVALTAEGTPPVGLAAQTRFTLYVTTFYHEPGPADYAAFA